MFVAASTRCFSDKGFAEACHLITDLEFDKIEIWFDDQSGQVRPSDVVKNIEGFYAQFREATRLTPVAFTLEHDVPAKTLHDLCKLAKLMKVSQITVPSSPLGTPFNEEIDRLRTFVRLADQETIRISLKTKTGTLTEDPRTAVELCQAVKGLGLTLDPSYYLCGPHSARGIDSLMPYTYHVHLRDSTVNHLQIQVGLGEVDYTRLISQLRKENFDRVLSVELFPELYPADVNRPLELRKLRMLLETLL
jgi:sugar phosphate isomerase/epimerase